MKWSIADLVFATNGEIVSSLAMTANFSSISTDSRSLQKGALYIAIKGKNFDGHQFIEQALQKGAAVVLVSEDISIKCPVVKVADTRIALGQFAKWHRQQSNLKELVAITGSNGKTTCKDMVHHLLSSITSDKKVLATEGNLNNDFGVPRTLLLLEKQHQYAVIEMGANHQKEIDYVSNLASSDVSLITLAAGMHLEGFGSLEGVIKSKAEIMNGMNSGGTVVLNMDSPGFGFWQKHAKEKSLQIVSFGKAKQADFRLLDYQQQTTDLTFKFSYQTITYSVTLPMLGEHNAFNALASIVTCFSLVESAGFNLEAILPHLASFAGVAGRLQQIKLPNKGLLLDDTYNAGPSSMRAAIDVLVSVSSWSIFCMGSMGEVGKDSIQQHQLVAEYAKQKGVSYLLCCGEETKNLPKIFGKNAWWFENKDLLTAQAINLINAKQADSCLVKGSRYMQMEQIVTSVLKGVK